MGNYWTNAVRHPEDVGVGHIRRTVRFDNTNVGTTGIPIGALEAGAVPYHAQVTVIDAFNAATTNVLTLGTAGTPEAFAAAAGTVAGTAGFKSNLTGTETGKPLATNTVVYARYTQSGAAATAGSAIVTLYFVNKREIEGRAFPNNP